MSRSCGQLFFSGADVWIHRNMNGILWVHRFPAHKDCQPRPFCCHLRSATGFYPTPGVSDKKARPGVSSSRGIKRVMLVVLIDQAGGTHEVRSSTTADTDHALERVGVCGAYTVAQRTTRRPVLKRSCGADNPSRGTSSAAGRVKLKPAGYFDCSIQADRIQPGKRILLQEGGWHENFQVCRGVSVRGGSTAHGAARGCRARISAREGQR